ncbi:RNA-directed DNA polymerase [Abeliophyllum distichum]|uniref:RNA-directed DNA polymerase n=1 Tax=Abeliophyllum distichum TaxID=126358 RepID=A0ABD1V7N0_9LAMI
MGKYFSQSLKDQKEAEFLQLMQENMPLGEYERKFERLSRYAPHMVNTELTKAKRFELGLRQEIKGIMAAQQHTTYAEALRRAQAISTGLGLEEKILPSSEVSKKREWNELYAENGNGQNKKANNESGSKQTK